MAILVSGGAGYIGSHTCIELLNAGYDIVVADNYYNASPVVLDRVKQITGKDFRFYNADMTRHEDVEKIFSECPDITAVIQFAAYKAVGESVSKPIEYYYNNLNCTLVILDVMRKHNCHNFVFSSSATVYGDPASVPITEDFPVGATTNPYGTTKAFTERILTDVCKADPSLNVALLRYFNPIGAHKSGLIGEDPNGIPNNLMPYIAKVAVGKLEKVHVFGNDYPTPDGTGVRDYIHVVDLARGHVCAIRKLETNCGLFICNLGTGKGYSVLDVMRKHNCHNFVFSSSATVYGDPASVPITEDFPVGATTNPYGTTKAMTERILTDVCKADPTLNVALLRYFNPIGAHKSGLIGEDPNGIPNNLMPYIAKVAVGKLEKVHVFGNDYPTPDGTGVRDYIHVVDLARGHVCAIKKLETNCGLFICNLGTGKGYSVLDVIHAFEKACGKPIPYVIEARRPGDIAECYADPTKAKNELGWVAE